MNNRIDEIEELLIQKLEPTRLIIDDKTHQHLTHAGHSPSKIHLLIEIESPLFLNKSKIQQHQLVLKILKPYLKDVIHSVSLSTHISEN